MSKRQNFQLRRRKIRRALNRNIDFFRGAGHRFLRHFRYKDALSASKLREPSND